MKDVFQIRTNKQFLHWQSEHKKKCCIVHIGSSGSMEKEGAIEIFLRSIEKRNLKYTVFVGDGDTDCFGSVRDKCRRIYVDSYIVTEEECIGHLQKRLGTALRKYQSVMRGTLMADGKTTEGEGRLTHKVIDKIQRVISKNDKGYLGSFKVHGS